MEVLELIFEILFEVFGEVLLERGWSRVKKDLNRENHHPVLASAGYFLIGVVLGGVALWLHPGRLLSRGPVPGASLIVAPILSGVAMHFWGIHRRGQGRATTNLATFYGGAAFAFGVSLIRFLGIR